MVEGAEEYLMNRYRGKPLFSTDQSILDAAKEFALKDEKKKADKKKAEGQNLNLDNNNQAGKKVPILKITKGKLGTKTKKKDIDEDDHKQDKKNAN